MKAGDCKHYTGTLSEACEAGVNYRLLAGEPKLGWGRRLPCLPSLDASSLPKADRKVSCDKFEPITQAEIDERIRDIIENGEIICELRRR